MNMMKNEIDPNTPIDIYDIRDQQVVRTGTYKQIKTFRRSADRKDLQYGAVRYTVRIHWED